LNEKRKKRSKGRKEYKRREKESKTEVVRAEEKRKKTGRSAMKAKA